MWPSRTTDHLLTRGRMTLVDVAGTLLAAALGLASRLIVVWVKEGRSRVRARERRLAIEALAEAQARDLSVRVADLQRETERMLRRIVRVTPELSYSPLPVLRTLRIDSGSRGTEGLVDDLRRRVNAIAAQDGAADFEPEVPRTVEVDYVVRPALDPERSAAPNRAESMIRELQDRIERRENPRQ